MSKATVISLKNDLAEIAKAQDLLKEFCSRRNVSRSVVNAMNLALEEVLTNIVNYGYEDEDKDEHTITVLITLAAAELIVEVRDDAKPFNPLKHPAPDVSLPLEEREIGGLGIHLVRRLMDDLEYWRRKKQNVLAMKKKLV